MPASILGVATCVPGDPAPPSRFDGFARKWAQPSAPLDKTIYVNSRTGIAHRPSLHDENSAILNRPQPAPIQDIVSTFLTLGLELAATAAERALADWGGDRSRITHLICTTCTASSHPGYDVLLHQTLGLGSDVERTLIHGIGCAGGMSILRLAKTVCAAAETTGRPARVLLVALEVTSTLIRTELEALDEEAERGGTKPNVAATIFSDAASAMVVGSGPLGDDEHASFEVRECVVETVAETRADLAFDIHEKGWRAIISPRVPGLTSQAVPALFDRLIATVSTSPATPLPSSAPAYDWFIHPGGSLIISTLQKTLSLQGPADDATQTAASWQMYRERGNASSASIGGVIERGRRLGGREDVVAVAFGPGVSVEMALLRRTGWKGREAATSTTGNGVNGVNGVNGHGHSHDTGPLPVVNGDGDSKGKGGAYVAAKAPTAIPSDSTMSSPPYAATKTADRHGAGRTDVSACVCTRRNLFGGSGFDCWCRS